MAALELNERIWLSVRDYSTDLLVVFSDTKWSNVIFAKRLIQVVVVLR